MTNYLISCFLKYEKTQFKHIWILWELSIEIKEKQPIPIFFFFITNDILICILQSKGPRLFWKFYDKIRSVSPQKTRHRWLVGAIQMHPRKLSSLAQDIENVMLNVLQLIPMSIVHPLLLEPIYVFLPTFYDVYHLSLFFYDLLESYKEAVQLENKKYIEVLQKNISYWTILVCHPIETFIDKKKIDHLTVQTSQVCFHQCF